MITVNEALIHLGYEEADADDPVVMAHVKRILNAAISTLKGAVGDDVISLMPNDPRAIELVTQYMDDLHSNSGTTSNKVNTATRYFTQTLELQLQCELNRLREAVNQ